MTILYSDKDAYTHFDNPTYNYGISSTLYADYETNIRKIYLNFDTSSISITERYYILNFYYISSGTNRGDCYIRRVTETWNEGTKDGAVESGVITYNNAPTVTDVNKIGFNPASGGWETIDITQLVNDSSGSYFSLEIAMETNGGDIGIATYEFNPTWAPYLSYPDRRFVKTSGNDAIDGLTWANAWKTINKAANTLTDGQDVHIEGGTYNAEPASNDIAPVNAGLLGIGYTVWGTAGTGDADGTGTGTVTVEKNA